MNRVFYAHAHLRHRLLRMPHRQSLSHQIYMCRFSTATDSETIRQQCLAILRTMAQPVSVLTTLDWEAERNQNRKLGGLDGSIKSNVPPETDSGSHYRCFWHGTTLSSFTSIAMYPYPLVSFSLRTPARMADLLRPLVRKISSNSAPKIQLAINLLASHQSHLAIHFSHPRGSPSGLSSFQQLPSAEIQFTCTKDGIPIIHDTLGALCCTLIKSIPLDTVHPEFASLKRADHSNPAAMTSELFIARVMHVLPSPRSCKSPEAELPPLVYHKQQYSTVK